MADTWLDIAQDALYLVEAYGPGDSIPDHDLAFCKRCLNRVLDQWAALRRMAYNVTFTLYTLTADHQPHLIGPGLSSPDFAATQRPVRIEGAALVLDPAGNEVDIPVAIRDDDWWRRQRVKTVTSSVPTNLYPSYDVPNVGLYFWPVPNAAWGMRLETWVSLAQVDDLTTDFVGPQGTNLALVKSLIPEICTAFGKPRTVDMLTEAARARAAVQTNYGRSPRVSTADFGTGAGRRGGGDFNFYTGGRP